jgi:hypothetical protein
MSQADSSLTYDRAWIKRIAMQLSVATYRLTYRWK